MIQHEFITFSLEQFGRILRIPYTGQCAFTNEWDLSSLSIFQKPKGTYHTELPTPDDIHRFLRLEHVESNRLIKGKNVDLSPKRSSSHQFNDDKEIKDEDTSRASTPSPTTYMNSLPQIRPQVMDIQKKDKYEAKPDKTEYGIGKSAKKPKPKTIASY
ncbi:hypothetical protein Tco_1430389 [Tanacetum coccineum]